MSKRRAQENPRWEVSKRPCIREASSYRTRVWPCLKRLGEFLVGRFRVPGLHWLDPISTLRRIDLKLLRVWQSSPFLTPTNLAFVYVLCRECIPGGILGRLDFEQHLRCCLYVAYSYVGSETGYPRHPFVVCSDGLFLRRCLAICLKMSSEMMRLASDPVHTAAALEELMGGDALVDGPRGAIRLGTEDPTGPLRLAEVKGIRPSDVPTSVPLERS